MSKRSDRRAKQRKATHKPKTRVAPAKPATDRAIYFILGVIGLFFVLLGWLMTNDNDPRFWRILVLVYLIFFVWMVNLSAFQVIRGKHVAAWKGSLARIPLRSLGYTGPHGEGKPMEAASHDPDAPKAVMTCLAISVLLLAGAAALLIPGVVW